MILANIQEFQIKVRESIDALETTLITRNGLPAAFLIPLEAKDVIPDNLRRELLKQLGAFIRQEMSQANVTEEEILNDFKQTQKDNR